MNTRNLEGDARVAHADAHPTARCMRCDQHAELTERGGEAMCVPCAEWADEVEAAPEPEDHVARWIREGARLGEEVRAQVELQHAADQILGAALVTSFAMHRVQNSEAAE